MPLTPPLIYADMASARAACSFPFTRMPFDQLAWALASGIVQWAPTVQLTGVSVGTAGAGTINTLASKVFLAPNPPLAIAGMGSAGLVGPPGIALGTVIGQAVPKALTSYAGYAGGVAGVGVGGDVSKVVAASGSGLAALLVPLLAGFLGPGPASAQMAKGLGQAVANLVLTATATGNVVGTPSPSAASGVSKSVLV